MNAAKELFPWLVCAIQVLTLAITNAYWRMERDIYTRDRTPRLAPSELYLAQSAWRR